MKIGLEIGVEGRSLAWALEHPGGFAYGSTGEAALEHMPAALWEYTGWLARHTSQPWLRPADPQLQAVDAWDVETWEVYSINEDFDLAAEGYEVNAWFLHDWKALTEEDIQRGLQLLAWSREDLLATVSDLSPEALALQPPGERWDIRGILRHVGGAEWWYLDRLGLAIPRGEVPEEPFERLEVVRAHLNAQLPTLVGKLQVVGVDGEMWSPRKLLRRAVWHERDHTEHIRRILEENEEA